MMIYLDNSATTKPYPEVIEVMAKSMNDYFGNPSSLHKLGVEAERVLTAARKTAAGLLGVLQEEIIYTSSGSEGNNLAIMGIAGSYGERGKHIITSQVEHSSVLEPFRRLERQGFEVTYLPVDRWGRISLTQLEEHLRSDTILVSIMHVNNEIGTIQPIEEIGELLKKYPKTVFHVDAVQSFGKLWINPKKFGIDLLTISGHKFHGPKGVGLLYKNQQVQLDPLILGGGQENGLRSGTENVPGIIAFTKAMRMSLDRMEQFQREVSKMRNRLLEGINGITGIKINSPIENSAPHIINFSVPGIKPEVLLHLLEEKGILVSTKSACSSKESKISHVLKATGIPEDQAKGAIRISLSLDNTMEEINYTIDALNAIIPNLKKVMRV